MIKPIYFFKHLNFFAVSLIISCSLQTAFAQEEENSMGRTQFGAHLNIDSPFRTVMPEMSTSGLFALSLGHSPFLGSPVYFELKAAWGGYSNEYSRDIYYAKNGWWYPAEADYNSGMQKYLLGSKVMAGKEFRKIRGFATPQIGLFRMRSKTTVTYWDGTGTFWNNDENDDGSKTAAKTPIKQTSWVYGAEIGAEISLDKLFKIKGDNNTFRLVVSGSFLRGFKDFMYADVDKMLRLDELGDEDPANYLLMSHPNVDEIYYVKPLTSALQMWGVNLGLNVNF
jgi:hypothetical protein